MVDKVLFSSKREDWETPQDFFDRLDAEFHFTLDAAASPENAKCEHYYTKEDDALTLLGEHRIWPGRVWCNPPYTKDWRVTYDFVRTGYESSLFGATVVMLLAARTDTQWFHDYAMNAAEIRFVKGRLQFVGGESKATFPSVVLVFKPGKHELKVTSYERP